MTSQEPYHSQITPLPIFSQLPIEVVKLIFEVSALSSDRTAANLARISKHVNSWVIPILYETIVISQPLTSLQILTTITSTRTAHFALFVRNICISLPGRSHLDYYTYGATIFPWEVPDVVDKLLRACANLDNLYLNDTHTHTRFRHPTNSYPLRHLHCGSWDTWLNHNFLSFDTLTHLRVDLAYNSAIGPTWAPLLPPSMRLPNLTHLAFGTDRRNAPSELRGVASLVRRMLTRQRLVMLALTLWFCWEEVASCAFIELFKGVADERLCVLIKRDGPDGQASVKEWEDEVQGKESIWDKAAAVMKRHRESAFGIHSVAVGISETDSTSDYR